MYRDYDDAYHAEIPFVYVARGKRSGDFNRVRPPTGVRGRVKPRTRPTRTGVRNRHNKHWGL